MNSSAVQDYRNPFSTKIGNTGIRFQQSLTDYSLRVGIGDDAGNFTAHVYRLNNNPLTSGTWYHVALVWDSTQNKVRGYLNGDAVFSGEDQTLWSSTFNDVKIGNGFSSLPEREEGSARYESGTISCLQLKFSRLCIRCGFEEGFGINL